MACLEAKHNPILVTHSNAVEPLPIAAEFFKPIPRWHPQVIDRVTGIQQIKFVPNSFPQLLRKPSCGFRVRAIINILRGLIGKRDDHER